MFRKRTRTYVIAEIGVNHNGNFSSAKELIGAAKDSGADAVKFQFFDSQSLVSAGTDMADYQKANTAGFVDQRELLRMYELSVRELARLQAHAVEMGLDFSVSVFSLDHVELLGEWDVTFVKVASGELTNTPLLRALARLGRPTLLSTGMATMDEIRKAVGTLSEQGLADDEMCVLQCTTEYPAQLENLNLLALRTFRDELGLPTGFSDHSQSVEAACWAVALGAVVVEKHLTLDQTDVGPDHSSSLSPPLFEQMIHLIRDAEKALGSGTKRPSRIEIENAKLVRKSLVANLPINRGERFSETNLTVQRPGTGIPAGHWDEVLGKSSTRSYRRGEFIKWQADFV